MKVHAASCATRIDNTLPCDCTGEETVTDWADIYQAADKVSSELQRRGEARLPVMGTFAADVVRVLHMVQENLGLTDEQLICTSYLGSIHVRINDQG